MIQPVFQQTGWQRLDNSRLAQDRIEARLKELGADVREFDVSAIETSYNAWRHLADYQGDYAIYNGPLEHCLLEKTLEHYVSLLLINPRKGMTAVDVGSCQSVFPALIRRIYGVECYQQDLDYPAGVADFRIGSSADEIPLPDKSVDFMTLHCTFEHFEGGVDSRFVAECRRVLKEGGKCVVLPLYLNESHCNITGELSEEKRKEIGWDDAAEHYCVIPEWQNRFGRHYSPETFMARIHAPAKAAGFNPRLLKIVGWETIHPDLWLRWVAVLD